mgnify:FL=1
MICSSPESTAFDLLRYQKSIGGIRAILPLLKGLSNHLDGPTLGELAPLFNEPIVQRLAFLLDFLEKRELCESLSRWLVYCVPRKVPLVPEKPSQGKLDPKWKIIINEQVD